MADTDSSRSRASSRATSRPETPQPSTPPVPVAGSSSAHETELPTVDDFLVGGPPASPSPIAIRASNSPSARRRKLQPEPPVDLQALEYVDQPDANLVCLICQCPFVQPRQVVACDHVFCKKCLAKAFEAQQARGKTCPTCRTPVQDRPREVHRLIMSMLDDLVVKCPNHELGCLWTDKRSHVQDHVELYCDYTMVDCPDINCNFEVAQKDFHRGCLHYTVNCPDCGVSILKRDSEDHQKDICEKRLVTCQGCRAELPKHEIDAHLSESCPKAKITCPGHICGCTEEDERESLQAHISSCPLAKFAPIFLRQQNRLDESDASNKVLHRKLDILEGGMSAIQELVYAHNPSATASSSNGGAPTAESFISPSAATADSNPHTPPFDSSVHHLLSLHESLRDELGRTTNNLADLDARTTMNQLNHQQRIREEFLQMNHAIGGMRMQLQWLISARLQAVSRAGPAGPNAMGGSNSGANSYPVRRPSDSNRQDPKL